MFRNSLRSALKLGRAIGSSNVSTTVRPRFMSHGTVECDEDFDERYVTLFNRADIDGWDIRSAMNDLSGMDLIPEPKIIDAALRACRRVNDYALAVRFVEAIRFKCAPKPGLYEYVLQEIKPTLDELGVDTPETLGYHKPELAICNVYEMH